MERKINGERGMSLVEVTIILMVLALLTAVIAPSVTDYVNDARQTKAKEDVEAIGTGLARMLRDTGAPFPLIDGTVAIADRFNMDNRADLLVGPGDTPAIDDTAHPTFVPGAEGDASLNWHSVNNHPLIDQLTTNVTDYDEPTFPVAANSGGPRFGLGWRGAYISALSADPWGKRYAVNSIFFGGAADATAKGWVYDVAVLSAGANSTVDSTFNQVGFVGGLDDVVYVIQGSTR